MSSEQTANFRDRINLITASPPTRSIASSRRKTRTYPLSCSVLLNKGRAVKISYRRGYDLIRSVMWSELDKAGASEWGLIYIGRHLRKPLYHGRQRAVHDSRRKQDLGTMLRSSGAPPLSLSSSKRRDLPRNYREYHLTRGLSLPCTGLKSVGPPDASRQSNQIDEKLRSMRAEGCFQPCNSK